MIRGTSLGVHNVVSFRSHYQWHYIAEKGTVVIDLWVKTKDSLQVSFPSKYGDYFRYRTHRLDSVKDCVAPTF